MKAALKRGIDSGILVSVKHSYKLSAEGKKEPKEKKIVLKKKSSPIDKKVR
jgi:hypothetical protein